MAGSDCGPLRREQRKGKCDEGRPGVGGREMGGKEISYFALNMSKTSGFAVQ